MIKVGIVVGEYSGDVLGASLVRALKAQHPTWYITGIGGDLLAQAGCDVVMPLQELNVMGLIEPLKKLPQLWRVRQKILKYFKHLGIDLFIGVDYPDFNLNLARALKQHGVTTIHYVSPSVWAWRQYRVKTIARAVDVMLTLFPFEVAFYAQHQVKAVFTGHPLADQIPLTVSTQTARQELGLSNEVPILTVLVGSRAQELQHLLEVYVQAMQRLAARQPLHVVFPVVQATHAEQVKHACTLAQVSFTYDVLVGQTRQAIAACDVACVTSGTATLEVMLHKKPMVVCYRMPWLTFQLAKRLVKVPYISLPNLIIDDMVVPELIQHTATPDNIMQALQTLLTTTAGATQVQHFTHWHQHLRQQAALKAAQVVTDQVTA